MLLISQKYCIIFENSIQAERLCAVIFVPIFT
nr:MAG TPA: hypothetical protein [Caudoviricetes sp.]